MWLLHFVCPGYLGGLILLLGLSEDGTIPSAVAVLGCILIPVIILPCLLLLLIFPARLLMSLRRLQLEKLFFRSDWALPTSVSYIMLHVIGAAVMFTCLREFQ
jgi:hypothetical protein